MQKLPLALLCLLPVAASAAEPEVLNLPGSDMTCRLLYKEYNGQQYPNRLVCARGGQVVFEDDNVNEAGASGVEIGGYLTAMDFDLDGHTDLRMLINHGSAGPYYYFYVYSPSKRTLEYRREFGVCSEAMDAQKCCIGRIRAGVEHSYENRICLRDNEMIIMRSDDYTWDEKTGCQVTRRSERQSDGSMKVVRETVGECSAPH